MILSKKLIDTFLFPVVYTEDTISICDITTLTLIVPPSFNEAYYSIRWELIEGNVNIEWITPTEGIEVKYISHESFDRVFKVTVKIKGSGEYIERYLKVWAHPVSNISIGTRTRFNNNTVKYGLFESNFRYLVDLETNTLTWSSEHISDILEYRVYQVVDNVSILVATNTDRYDLSTSISANNQYRIEYVYTYGLPYLSDIVRTSSDPNNISILDQLYLSNLSVSGTSVNNYTVTIYRRTTESVSDSLLKGDTLLYNNTSNSVYTVTLFNKLSETEPNSVINKSDLITNNNVSTSNYDVYFENGYFIG